jgi:hypothetical protein
MNVCTNKIPIPNANIGNKTACFLNSLCRNNHQTVCDLNQSDVN